MKFNILAVLGILIAIIIGVMVLIPTMDYNVKEYVDYYCNQTNRSFVYVHTERDLCLSEPSECLNGYYCIDNETYEFVPINLNAFG